MSQRRSTPIALALVAGIIVAGCASSSPPPPVQPPMPAEMRVNYQCDNVEQVTVRFFPQQGIGVLMRGGQNTELQGQETTPGFTYTNGQTTLRVAPDRLSMTMNVGMMATATCRAR